MTDNEILREFYRGNLDPADHPLHYSKRRKQLGLAVTHAEDQLKEALSEEQWKLFEAVYLSAALESSCAENEDSFLVGFEMGAKFMLAALSEGETM